MKKISGPIWWPLSLNNWWKYSQINYGLSPSYRGVCTADFDITPADRMAWWVIPPDLSFRADASRTLAMFKTHPCMYNFRGRHVNVRWSLRYPGKFNILPEIPSIQWQLQTGVVRYDATGPDYDPASVAHRLPFWEADEAYKMDGTYYNGTVRQQVLGNQPPYILFPVQGNFTVPIELNSPDFQPKTAANWQKAKHFTFGVVTSTNPWQWHTRFSLVKPFNVPGYELLPLDIRSQIGGDILEVRYAEFNPGPQEIYCERWHYAPNIGPILIDSTVVSGTDVEACLDHPFNTNFSRTILQRFSVAPLPINGGYDSPDIVANTEWGGSNELFYVKNGFWWTYELGTGRLISHGRLEDIWADKICPGCTGPFPYSVGTKVAGVWSPLLAQAITGNNQAKFVLFIDGKYWVWRRTSSNNKWFATGSTASLFAGAPPCLGKLPTTNNGPQAVCGTADELGIHLYNEGCVWQYKKSGSDWIWVQNPYVPSPVAQTFATMPEINHRRPNAPTAAIQFNGGEYLQPGVHGYPATNCPTQHILFEDGRIWLTDNCGHNETWGGIWDLDI